MATALYHEKNKVLHQLQTEAAYEQYLAIAKAVSNKNSAVANATELEAVMENPLLQSDQCATSFRAKLLY